MRYMEYLRDVPCRVTGIIFNQLFDLVVINDSWPDGMFLNFHIKISASEINYELYSQDPLISFSLFTLWASSKLLKYLPSSPKLTWPAIIYSARRSSTRLQWQITTLTLTSQKRKHLVNSSASPYLCKWHRSLTLSKPIIAPIIVQCPLTSRMSSIVWSRAIVLGIELGLGGVTYWFLWWVRWDFNQSDKSLTCY